MNVSTHAMRPRLTWDYSHQCWCSCHGLSFSASDMRRLSGEFHGRWMPRGVRCGRCGLLWHQKSSEKGRLYVFHFFSTKLMCQLLPFVRNSLRFSMFAKQTESFGLKSVVTMQEELINGRLKCWECYIYAILHAIYFVLRKFVIMYKLPPKHPD